MHNPHYGQKALRDGDIDFPEGTIRTEEMLRTHSEHYRIALPDGYMLYESYDWSRKISFLLYQPE